ncbi:MAG: polyprenyl synthetase family protein [Clostridiales Family XIII bacterium]|jgi:heptaprenyl diphosphate synthase|nr:polyprenyl synthetase family protein [Clostridiales Family XIII bacterium]
MIITKADTEIYYNAFRRCHSERALTSRPEASVLIGDYFFSLFAKSLLMTDRLDEAPRYAERLEAEIESLLDADVMRADAGRILSAGGKGLRTKLARICYDIGRERSPDPRADGAEELEPLLEVLDILHNTSLIHDDAVDGAELRRGVPTINKTTGIFAAVQTGDWLLAEMVRRFYRCRTPENEAKVDEMFTFVPLVMCEGELIQQRIRFRLSAQTKQLYYQQIHRKTAALFAASCRAGAVIAGGTNPAVVKLLERFGRLFGIAFQIRDDVLDFCPADVTGKRHAQDIRNGIFTLPILMAEADMPAHIRALLEKRDKSEGDIGDIVTWVTSSGSLDRARREAERLFSEAADILRSLGQSREIKKLNELCESIVS